MSSTHTGRVRRPGTATPTPHQPRTDVRKPVISLMQPDVIGIEINPCGRNSNHFSGVGGLVPVAPLDRECVRLESRSTAPSGATAFIYEHERDPSAR